MAFGYPSVIAVYHTVTEPLCCTGSYVEVYTGCTEASCSQLSPRNGVLVTLHHLSHLGKPHSHSRGRSIHRTCLQQSFGRSSGVAMQWYIYNIKPILNIDTGQQVIRVSIDSMISYETILANFEATVWSSG